MFKKDSFFYFLLPASCLLFLVILGLHKHSDLYKLFFLKAELGIMENLQAICLAVTLIFSIKKLKIICHKTKDRKIWIFSVLVFLGLFYILGEEISWGQHYFQWSSGKIFSELNIQNETNLHNISSWFNEKPRAIFEITIFLMCFFIPLFIDKNKRIAKYIKTKKLTIYIPNKKICFTVLIIIVTEILEDSVDIRKFGVYLRLSEVEELFVYYFMFLYIRDFYCKLNRN